MPRPATLQGSQHHVSFSTSREREFYRYLPPHHLQSQALQHFDRDTPSSAFVARSSSDAVLTAFAQLGALRLDAKRATVSLFGRHEQHVLTEATRTLSLQDDTDHKERDQLWMGSCTVSYDRSFCKAIANPPQISDDPHRMLVVPDLTQEEEYRDHPDVRSYPNIRFVACSPIISPKGIVIGAYTVYDDKPHGPLDADLTKFLRDVASTVMDYLVATRSRTQHLRSERMIVGIGSLLEGKGSLRSSWVDATDDMRTHVEEKDWEGHIDQEQQEKQASDDVLQAMGRKDPQGSLPFRPHNFNTSRGQKATAQDAQQQALTDSKISTRDHFQARPRHKRAPHATITEDEGSRKQSPKACYTTQVKDAFSRAANIIRESMQVEAAVFFDSNSGSHRCSLDNSKSDTDSSSMESCSSSDEGVKARSVIMRHELSAEAQTENSGKSTVHSCQILGFATSDASSVNNQELNDPRIALSENFLEGLLHRYPRGKIFNFGEDGSISSEDTSDGVFKNMRRSGGKRYKKTHKAFLRQDAATLLQLAPNARSIAFSPLWDSHKERWFSGCLSWTTAPHRVFAANDELAFLFAVGNSLMADVHRLGSVFAERAKSDLLAGISHELRSPLHGIFGTIEILNDTVMDALQQGFVHTISSCAFTLLGSIDQLLEYASINDVRPSSRIINAPGRLEVKSNQGVQPERSDETSTVQLDVAVEDVVETVFAGHCFFSHSGTPLWGSNSNPFDLEKGVRVVLDVDRTQSFKFLTRPGAWHVIMTNIFGNALKFTQEGYIYVSLKADPVDTDANGQVIRSTVTLRVSDTGCGMEQDFVRNQLSTAFSQEDSMSTGNGLGFNIVRRIVSSLGGDIHVESQKGVGTEVVMKLTLDHVLEWDVRDDNAEIFPMPTRAVVREKTIGLIGLGSSDRDATLFSALQKLCRDWFQMEIQSVAASQAQFGYCDFYISLQDSLDIGRVPISTGPTRQLFPPVIIICSTPRIAHSMFLASRKRKDAEVLEFISQPCGPRKLAKTLEMCAQRQQRRIDAVRDNGVVTATPADPPLPPTPREFDRPSFLQMLSPGTNIPPKFELKRELPFRSNGGSMSPSESSEPLQEDGGNSGVSAGASRTSVSHSSGEQSPPPEQPRQPTTVLLVDDNEINLKLLVAFMKKLGCKYATAQNGQEALDCFKENPHDIGVVLMDISMPVMDGLESTRLIRDFEKTLENKDRTAILALTAVAQTEVERDAMRSGMDTFLTKPVRLNSLGPIIKEKVATSKPTQKSKDGAGA
ncbi:hypothetical protein BO70DRAFT_400405 [Aspergillus heteromorphus CBS 117.55]|uniref:histidine kinase n=1 Tax=Aspergillus heteromorphus CBS 117.55 TaxID=1448321 RepID=A0A317V6C6_9EURO|nr:uncharacterized protein BO70DRAFT_400405 [Aspergillus heteromorphus CBS 117.55]PWY68487.1 hypothetical protein BO70DRAFT_400405 [Aspergillus heteromorphus CBS 117.55]